MNGIEPPSDGAAEGNLQIAGGAAPSRQVRRPKQGEVRWYATGIEVDKDGGREIYYGWTEVGGQSIILKALKADAARKMAVLQR